MLLASVQNPVATGVEEKSGEVQNANNKPAIIHIGCGILSWTLRGVHWVNRRVNGLLNDCTERFCLGTLIKSIFSNKRVENGIEPV